MTSIPPPEPPKIEDRSSFNYYIILFENIIVIFYMFLFLYGFFIDDVTLSLVGGVGTTLFILIITIGQSSNQYTLLFFYLIGLFIHNHCIKI